MFPWQNGPRGFWEENLQVWQWHVQYMYNTGTWQNFDLKVDVGLCLQYKLLLEQSVTDRWDYDYDDDDDDEKGDVFVTLTPNQQFGVDMCTNVVHVGSVFRNASDGTFDEPGGQKTFLITTLVLYAHNQSTGYCSNGVPYSCT